MAESRFPDQETQWNLEKDSRCQLTEQRERETQFKINGLEEVQHLANQEDYANYLDLKSKFRHTTVSPNSIPYLVFNLKNYNYAYKAIPLGAKHSPIFFEEVIESILKQIKLYSQIKILKYCDYILLVHDNDQIFYTQTIEITKILEIFGWAISKEK
ncbi:MAG: hypothetical protein EZS28_044478 [Streblomastix strix]|uniref:Reverse transcriptase domain-containing protein n=1 Tax=Streblomastix strix TaxID=222440 RepID=A0A5J4TN85_9EUKA|nr:MAG: hypothetical protein EZS28_044478 [Streblomastix strix]